MTDSAAPLELVNTCDPRIAEARLKLAGRPPARASAFRGLAAATLAAVSALVLAASVVVGPGFLGHPVRSGASLPAQDAAAIGR